MAAPKNDVASAVRAERKRILDLVDEFESRSHKTTSLREFLRDALAKDDAATKTDDEAAE